MRLQCTTTTSTTVNVIWGWKGGLGEGTLKSSSFRGKLLFRHMSGSIIKVMPFDLSLFGALSVDIKKKRARRKIYNEKQNDVERKNYMLYIRFNTLWTCYRVYVCIGQKDYQDQKDEIVFFFFFIPTSETVRFLTIRECSNFSLNALITINISERSLYLSLSLFLSLKHWFSTYSAWN